HPGTIPLLLDQHGHVTETTAANILVVSNGAVVTPLRTSILGGVSLQVVEELCGELSLRFEERPLTLYDCVNAQEVVLTRTPYCVAGVSRINHGPIPWPGPPYRRLLDAWSARVGNDIERQILSPP